MAIEESTVLQKWLVLPAELQGLRNEQVKTALRLILRLFLSRSAKPLWSSLAVTDVYFIATPLFLFGLFFLLLSLSLF